MNCGGAIDWMCKSQIQPSRTTTMDYGSRTTTMGYGSARAARNHSEGIIMHLLYSFHYFVNDKLTVLLYFFFDAGCSCDEKSSYSRGQLTKLANVRKNATRWLSTYQMIDRYFKIQMQLSALVELLTLLPTSMIEVDIPSRGFKCFQKLQDITILFQRDGIPFSEVRGIFNPIIIFSERMEHHLGRTSSLVTNPDFEEGIMRIAKGTMLTAAQLVAVLSLVKMDMTATSVFEGIGE